MTSTAHGLYREPSAESGAGAVYVSYGAHGFSVPEAYYRQQGYRPDFDALPTKDEYEARGEGAAE